MGRVLIVDEKFSYIDESMGYAIGRSGKIFRRRRVLGWIFEKQRILPAFSSWMIRSALLKQACPGLAAFSLRSGASGDGPLKPARLLHRFPPYGY